MDILTGRQGQILQFIRQTIQEKGVSPSVREIGRHFHIASPNAVHGHLKALRDKRRLEDSGSAHRALRVAGHHPPVQVPLLGRVQAGLPVLAEENIEAYLPVGKDLVRHGRVFALRVKGDSMRDMGILDWDTVIVRQQSTAENGSIVVAIKGEEATVKRYRHRRGEWFLEPANPAFSPLPAKEFSILGIVVGVIRSYPS
jgi:repressor LexA